MSETTEVEYEVSDRGFRRYEPVATDYGHVVRVYESSAAKGPCIWMAVEAENCHNSDEGELHVHMTDKQAGEVVDSIQACRLGHYQMRDASVLEMETEINRLRNALSKISNHVVDNPAEFAWEVLKGDLTVDRLVCPSCQSEVTMTRDSKTFSGPLDIECSNCETVYMETVD